MTLIKRYFTLTAEYIAKYGENTILLMQVGGFYEVYGKRNRSGELYGSKIVEFREAMDCLISPKSNGSSIMMAGYPISQKDKLINKLTRVGYNVVVWEQDEFIKEQRSETGIYSAGTNFNLDNDKLTNNITCIWIEKHKKTMITKAPYVVCGLANIDILTGKSNLFEFKQDFFHNPTTYDDLDRFLSIYSPNEVIILQSNFSKNEIQDIIRFTGCNTISAPHIINLLSTDHFLSARAQKVEKQTYQKKILEQFYTPNDWDFFYNNCNFREVPIATQSFCFLLDFVHQHNPELVRKINEPTVDNICKNLILANHSLKQLNITSNSQHSGKFSSICSLLNECKTPMGKRKLNLQILNPTINIEWLQNEYDITNYIKNNFDKLEFLRREFINFYDIEKLYRKIILNQVNPSELYQFYKNMKSIIKIDKKIKTDKTIMTYLSQYIKNDIQNSCKTVMKKLEKNLDISKSAKINTTPFEVNIFKRNIYPDLDKIEQEKINNMDYFYCTQNYLSNLILQIDRKTKNKKVVKEHMTEKLGYSLIATTRRIKLLQQKLPKENIKLYYTSSYDNKESCFELDTDSFKYTTSTSNNKKIESPNLNELYSNITLNKIKLISRLSDIYKEFIQSLSNFNEEMKNMVTYVSLLDIIVTKAHIAKKYNYCCPVIEERNKSFFNAKKLRHCLIEHLQTNEIYKPNDVSLGDKADGILLYGTNAVGKSSLIRSIGIAIVLAQSGLFVPCESFVYQPYTAIFTRILGNDDIFKGLSTFATEMSELRTILRLSDQNSLILGDELCSGTETSSAIAIFVSGLIDLHQKKTSFIFATHFHEISKMDKWIKPLNRLQLKHMEVIYDRQKKELIYNRTLKDGPGNCMYGLRVCRSLMLPQDFLERASQIRQSMNPEEKNILNQNVSRYNSKKIKGKCELCGNIGVDIHHLNYQEDADNNGFIGSFHMNHPANLINICTPCHAQIHKKNKKCRKTKTSNGFKILDSN